MIPTWAVALFIIVQLLAREESLPLFLRFNLKQAVVLSYIASWTGFLAFVAWYLPIGPTLVAEGCNLFSLTVIAPCIFYLFCSSVFGRVPDSLPGISDVVRKGLR